MPLYVYNLDNCDLTRIDNCTPAEFRARYAEAYLDGEESDEEIAEAVGEEMVLFEDADTQTLDQYFS